MEFLSDLLGLTRLRDIKKANLRLQADVDAKLSTLQGSCGDSVAELLLAIRASCRAHQREVIDAKLTDSFSQAEKEIAESDRIYREINAHLRPGLNQAQQCRIVAAKAKRLSSTPNSG
jgi:hypothetical protein